MVRRGGDEGGVQENARLEWSRVIYPPILLVNQEAVDGARRE